MKLVTRLFGCLLAVALTMVVSTELRAGGENDARCGGTINWISKTCFSVVPVQACKWNNSVDTIKINRDPFTPYKFVDHMPGADTVCFLQMEPFPKGKTAHDYAKMVVKYRLQGSGISNIKVKDRVLNGRNIAEVSGYQAEEDSYMTLFAWRNRKIGVNLQCFCQDKNCNPGTTASFERFADSVRFVSEEGCIENRN